MGVSLGRFGPLAAFALFLLGALAQQAEAQYPPGGRVPNTVGQQGMYNAMRINPNPYLGNGRTLNQTAYNTTVLGRAASNVPPYALGYNPYSNRAGYGVAPGIAPALAPPPVGPDGGYGVNTAGSGYGVPGYYGGYGLGSAYGNALAGQAAVIGATGEYYNQIEQAKLTQQQVKQTAITTRKMLLQEQIDYERMRPKGIDIVMREKASELDWARRAPADADIWSGKTLNVLLDSCLQNPYYVRGPLVPLDESVLMRINLKDKSQRGNIGLLSEGNGKLRWPTGLQDESFDESRDRLTKNLEAAGTQLLKYGDPPDVKTMRALRVDYKTMAEKLDNGSVEGLSPSDFIRAKSYLTKIKNTITALNEPTVGASLDKSWVKTVRNVADLVGHMQNKGLEFAGSAVPTNNASYSSLYYSLRTFEMGLNSGGSDCGK